MANDQAMLEREFFEPIATSAGSSWDPKSVSVTLNVTFDACFVPYTSGSASGMASVPEMTATRLDAAHLVVLDGFLDSVTHTSLLDTITHPGESSVHGRKHHLL
jgi:hypothetical protein